MHQKETKEVIVKDTNSINIIQTETKQMKSTLSGKTEDTPMIANLMLFKEIQESNSQSLNKSETNVTITQVENDESIEQTGDSDTACEEYTDDDLDEALADEADGEEDSISINNKVADVVKSNNHDKNFKELSLKIYENEQFNNNEKTEESFLDESHYLPMTPKRFDVGLRGELNLLSLNDSNAEEENPYVEMTKFIQDEEAKCNYEIMGVGTNDGLKLKQNEPVYMELAGLVVKNATTQKSKGNTDSEQRNGPLSSKSILKKCKKGGDTLKKKVKKTSERVQNKRKDLPDILKTPQSIINLPSDSSDADDESSKQMEAKKMRSRTCFSMSDTFRPASYYLDSAHSNNCTESSESEILSQPVNNTPSPKIMEEHLETEEIFSSEIYDTVKRRESTASNKLDLSAPMPKIHASNVSLNLPKGDATLKCSRLSLPDQFTKTRNANNHKTPLNLILKHHERTLSDSNYCFQTDSSNNSSDFDLYNKLKMNSPSFIVTPMRYDSNSSLPQKYANNVLPLGLGDSSEAESVELRSSQTSDSELEKHRSRRPLSQDSINEIESLNEKFEERLTTHDLDSYLSNLQSSDINIFQNASSKIAGTPTPCAGVLTNLIKPPEIFRNKDDDNFYGNINFASSNDSLQKVDSEQTTELQTSTDQEQASFYTPMHSRNNSNISEQSAPYYYSELNSSREMLVTPTTLNNQREITVHGFNIAHIQNPIEKTANSAEIFADKYQAVNKNLYKSGIEKLNYSSTKNLKTNDNIQHIDHNPHSNHLQQHVSPPIKISNFHTNQHMHRSLCDMSYMHTSRTHNSHDINLEERDAKSTNIVTAGQVENLTLTGGGVENVNKIDCGIVTSLDDNKNSKDMENNKNSSSFLGAQNTGELLWEEDALWRESLRRVSLRHAKSLDNLDRIAPVLNVKREPAKTKITRDVTYVNEHVLPHARQNLNKSLNLPNELSENDVYVQLQEGLVNPNSVKQADELYELLREDTSSTISHKSGEIDRETIRQWDAMSSGVSSKNANINNVEAVHEIGTEPHSGFSVNSMVQQLNASTMDENIAANGGGVLRKSTRKQQ